jgi:hypothetical protein
LIISAEKYWANFLILAGEIPVLRLDCQLPSGVVVLCFKNGQA